MKDEANADAKPNTSLIQRAGDLVSLWQAISDMDGELDPFIEKWLATVERDLAVKVDNYRFMQDSLEAESERMSAEAAKLKSAAVAMKRLAESLKERIKMAMAKMETDEVVGNVWRYKLSNTAPALLIDESSLPEEFFMKIITRVPDRERIKPLMELGEKIAGCELRPGKSLRSYPVKKAKK